MLTILIARIELAGRCDMELDADLLGWLSTLPQIGKTEMWLRHSYGLVGNLTGAERLLQDLVPGAGWSLAVGPATGARAVVAIPGPFGLESRGGIAPVAANALLAATLRAHAEPPIFPKEPA
jgi:hypothetical protein